MAEGFNGVPEEVLKEIYALENQQVKLSIREKAKDEFMPFVHHVYEGFIEGRHHRIIAEKLERVARGELKRLIVNMPLDIANQNLHRILCLRGFWGAIQS